MDKQWVCLRDAFEQQWLAVKGRTSLCMCGCMGTHAQASCVSSFHASKSTNVMRATTGVRSAQGSTRSGIRIPALLTRGRGLGHVQDCVVRGATLKLWPCTQSARTHAHV
jgi:hypothetical protein